MTRRRSGSVATTIGGIMAGVDQQIFRSTPPAQELVRHARPDNAVPTGDGRTIVIPPFEPPAAGRVRRDPDPEGGGAGPRGDVRQEAQPVPKTVPEP